VRIERIAISHEGDGISLGFDITNYPDKPPGKWEGRGYTTAFIEIDFFDIREIYLRTNQNTYRGNIDIRKNNEENLFIVKITCSLGAEFIAGAGIIQSVSGL
jgi:hypothetical protein